MIRYVPSSAAEALSNALWGLSRPPETRAPEDTQFLFGWITALDGNRWLVVDTDYEVNVHQDAVLDGIADILQPWIDSGELPLDTNEVLAAFIESKRGGRMIPWEAFPQFFKDASKSREELISLGLLPSSITP